MSQDERHRADGVFEGGGVKGIAFAGAIAAAEKDGGVREWVNIAGTSAGAIVAALLAVGYDAAGLQRILNDAKYPKFADCGIGGKWGGGLFNAVARMRGLAPGNYFHQWMSEQLAASPLAKKLDKTELTFADVKRLDLPPRDQVPDITDAQYERARYRLHVIGSEVTSGLMLLLPDALPNYQDKHGKPARQGHLPDRRRRPHEHELPVPVQAGRAATRAGKPHYVVDGGLLSNFPIWLFDSPNPKRPTWGFRLHSGESAHRGAAAPGDSAPALVGAASEGDVLGGDRGLGPRDHGALGLRADGEHPDARDQHHRLQPHAGERAVALRRGATPPRRRSSTIRRRRPT